MEDFMKKWHEDKKFRAKIKLCLYGLFIIFVTIYATSLNSTPANNTEKGNYGSIQSNTITIPETYHYNIEVNIDNDVYTYSGDKLANKITINKYQNGIISKYIYQDGTYYREEDGQYIMATKEDVYDVVNYNYINFESINNYLSKSIYENGEYHVYLKDVILNSESDNYFTITMTENNMIIDYTPLIKEFNQEITNYNVNIRIEDIQN